MSQYLHKKILLPIYFLQTEAKTSKGLTENPRATVACPDYSSSERDPCIVALGHSSVSEGNLMLCCWPQLHYNPNVGLRGLSYFSQQHLFHVGIFTSSVTSTSSSNKKTKQKQLCFVLLLLQKVLIWKALETESW